MMMNKKKPFSLHLDVDSFMPATAEEKEVISRMRPSSTFFRDGVKRLLKNKVATISLILIVLITLSSIIIPMFWPYSYDQMLGQTKGRPMDNSYNNLAPFQYGKTELKKIDKGESVFPHIFGTDAHGRDYFIRVVYGTRISLAVGFFASIIVLVIGMMIGAVAGYFGGRVDLFIMRIVDIIYSLPDMLVIILLSVVLGQILHVEGTILEKIGSNIISMFIVFGLLYWVGMARLIRGQILSLREQEYVLSAQATGAKARWIIRKHLLPNCISVVIISTALQIADAEARPVIPIRAADAAGNRPQAGVAHQVPMAVVDVLEAVNVKHQDGGRHTQARQIMLVAQAVDQLRQPIGLQHHVAGEFRHHQRTAADGNPVDSDHRQEKLHHQP